MLFKWSHHIRQTHTLPKNKVKALNLMSNIKGKINPVEMVMHQMMPKIKFMPPTLLKIKSKLKTVLKIKSKLKMMLKMSKMILKCPSRNFWSAVLLRWLPSSSVNNMSWRMCLEA